MTPYEKGRQMVMDECLAAGDRASKCCSIGGQRYCSDHLEVSLKLTSSRYMGNCTSTKIFCALSPCIEGFLEGCRPYVSIDSTALNGRWKRHMAAATAIDGHN
jgi:hypothetical protein